MGKERLHDGHKTLNRQGDDDDHEKAREVSPHAGGGADVDPAHHLLFHDGLGHLQAD